MLYRLNILTNGCRSVDYWSPLHYFPSFVIYYEIQELKIEHSNTWNWTYTCYVLQHVLAPLVFTNTSKTLTECRCVSFSNRKEKQSSLFWDNIYHLISSLWNSKTSLHCDSQLLFFWGWNPTSNQCLLIIPCIVCTFLIIAWIWSKQ